VKAETTTTAAAADQVAAKDRDKEKEVEVEVDAATELVQRIDAVEERIYFASLSTISRRLAEKTVAKTAREQGVFHIDIIVEAEHSPGADGVGGGGGRHAIRNTGGPRRERIILPINLESAVEAALNQATKSSKSARNSYTARAAATADAAVVRAIEKCLASAHAALQSVHAPTILITVSPLAKEYCQYLQSSRMPLNTTTTIGGGFPSASTLGALLSVSQSSSQAPSPAGSRSHSQVLIRRSIVDTSTGEEYSKAALTLAACLADHFARFISTQHNEQEKLAVAAALAAAKQTDTISTEVRIKPKIGTNPNSFRRGVQELPKRLLNSAAERSNFSQSSVASDTESGTAAAARRKSSLRDATFQLSQSVNMVAPWLQKARHFAFEEFLQSRINV
jgi:hypothetical protein